MPSSAKISLGSTSSSSATKARRSSGMRGVDFEPDHRSAPAPLQRRLEEAHEVFGLFLDFEIAVADDAEQALPVQR